MRGLALFDFDGTITTRDTLFEVVMFQRGKARFWLGMLVLLPVFAGAQIGWLPRSRAKEILLSYFFGGMDASLFEQACKSYSSVALPAIIRDEALARIREHQHRGDRVVVVTASAEDWIRDWCQAHNVELIATILEKIDGKITGRLKSLNCNGVEKVNRIKRAIRIEDYSPITAYGNSSADKQMLALANYPFYKAF